MSLDNGVPLTLIFRGCVPLAVLKVPVEPKARNWRLSEMLHPASPVSVPESANSQEVPPLGTSATTQ